jgi:hypothetical protein
MLPPLRQYQQLWLDPTSLPLAYAGHDDDGVQDAKHPLHLLNDSDTLVKQTTGDEIETEGCPTNTIPDTTHNGLGKKLPDNSLDNADEIETSVTYSVFVNMSRDIMYKDRDIYNCRQDKYLELLVNQKTIDKVQTAAVGRSNEHTKYYHKLSQKVVQQTIAPYQLRPRRKPVSPPGKTQRITGTGIGGQMKRRKKRRI